MSHDITYTELSVTDMTRARAFYEQALGWSFNDYGPEYTGLRRDGDDGEFGGLALAESVTTGGPLPVLFTDGLEAARDAVVAAGGSIEVDIFAFPGGRRFHLRDTEGNILAIASES